MLRRPVQRSVAMSKASDQLCQQRRAEARRIRLFCLLQAGRVFWLRLPLYQLKAMGVHRPRATLGLSEEASGGLKRVSGAGCWGYLSFLVKGKPKERDKVPSWRPVCQKWGCLGLFVTRAILETRSDILPQKARDTRKGFSCFTRQSSECQQLIGSQCRGSDRSSGWGGMCFLSFFVFFFCASPRVFLGFICVCVSSL